MKNPIAICLFSLGVLTIFVAFIAGIITANDNYDGFQFYVALAWWLSGIVAGIFFMGIGEIINLLQKLLNQKIDSAQSSKKFELAHSENNVLPNDNTIIESTEIKIEDLTIMLDDERFKGQFSFSKDDLKVFKISSFQPDSDAQLIMTIRKNNISPTYEERKDYFIFTYTNGNDTCRLAFKTFNIYDYQKIVNLLQQTN